MPPPKELLLAMPATSPGGEGAGGVSGAGLEQVPLADVLAQAPVPICVLEGPEHRYVFANPPYRQLVEGRELLGRTVREVLPQLSGQGLLALLDRVRLTGEAQGGQEARVVIARDGGGEEERFFDFTLQPFGGPDGRVAGIVLYAFEVTAQVQARRRAEEATRAAHQSEERYQHIFQSPLVGVALSDYEGHVLDANDSFLQLVGYDREAVREGRLRWTELTPEEYAEADRAAVRQLKAQGFAPLYEKEYRRADGTRLPVLVGATRVEAQRLSVTFVLDVSERTRAARMLGFLSEASRLLVESTHSPEETLRQLARLAVSSIADVASVDLVGADGRLCRVAAAARRPEHAALMPQLERFTPRPVEGNPVWEAVRQGRSLLVPDFTSAHEEASASCPEHLEALRAVGARSVMMAPLRARGRILGAMVLSSTQPQRYREEDLAMAEELARRAAVALEAARLLEESLDAERRYRFLADASRLLSVSLDFRTTLESLARLAVPTLADACAVDILSRQGTPERLAVTFHEPALGAEVLARFRDRPVDLAAPGGVGRVLRTGEVEWVPDVAAAARVEGAPRAEFLAALRDLGLRSILSVPLLSRGQVLGALTLVHAGSGRLYVAEDVRLAEDLAHRAALAVDNALLYREAQEAVRVRDEFLSVASHELKTPLTPLSLKLQVLGRDAEAARAGNAAAAERLAGHVDMARRQTARLTRLVHGLLDVSRIAAGKLVLERAETDLSALAAEAVAELEAQAARTGSPLSLHAPAPVVGCWDRQRLEQVLTNLLSNALKYGAGRPVHVEVAQAGRHARLCVRDEGIGIPPESLARIFERFERAVSERHYGGLGLGLYIARQIVEAHGGRIRAESEAGRGATFTVELPLTPGE